MRPREPFVHRCPPEAFDVNVKRCRACGLTRLDLIRLASGQAADSAVVPRAEIEKVAKSD